MGDSLEIASEASLHRLSKSGTAAIPCVNGTPHTSIDSRPASLPLQNRFPESGEEEQERLEESDESGDGEGGGPGSDCAAMSMGYATDEEADKKAELWTGIRGGNHSATSATFSTTTKSPGRAMDFDVSLLCTFFRSA